MYKVTISILLILTGFWVRSEIHSQQKYKLQLTDALLMANTYYENKIYTLHHDIYWAIQEIPVSDYSKSQADSIYLKNRAFHNINPETVNDLHCIYSELIYDINKIGIDSSPLVPLDKLDSENVRQDYAIYQNHISSIISRQLTKIDNAIRKSKSADGVKWQLITKHENTIRLKQKNSIPLHPIMDKYMKVQWNIGDSLFDRNRSSITLKGDYTSMKVSAKSINYITGARKEINERK